MQESGRWDNQADGKNTHRRKKCWEIWCRAFTWWIYSWCRSLIRIDRFEEVFIVYYRHILFLISCFHIIRLYPVPGKWIAAFMRSGNIFFKAEIFSLCHTKLNVNIFYIFFRYSLISASFFPFVSVQPVPPEPSTEGCGVTKALTGPHISKGGVSAFVAKQT